MCNMRIFVCNNESVSAIFSDLEKFRHTLVRSNGITTWDIGVARTMNRERFNGFASVKEALTLTKPDVLRRRLGWSLGLSQEELNELYWAHVISSNGSHSFKLTPSVLSRSTFGLYGVFDSLVNPSDEELDTLVRSSWLVSRFTYGLRKFSDPVCVIVRDQPDWNDRLTKLAV